MPRMSNIPVELTKTNASNARKCVNSLRTCITLTAIKKNPLIIKSWNAWPDIPRILVVETPSAGGLFIGARAGPGGAKRRGGTRYDECVLDGFHGGRLGHRRQLELQSRPARAGRRGDDQSQQRRRPRHHP